MNYIYAHLGDCQNRAALTIALSTADLELGVWALEQTGGVSQLMLLMASSDLRCQELASETMCLVSSSGIVHLYVYTYVYIYLLPIYFNCI
jgi:hypothetical protein